MDALFYYHAIAAVEESLRSAGVEGVRVSTAEGSKYWFNVGWLFDYLEGVEHRRLPLLWEGRAIPAFDSLEVEKDGWDRSIQRNCRHDLILIREEVVVGAIHYMRDGFPDALILVGEGRSGALQEFLDEYCEYARRRTREQPKIMVIGADPIDRPKEADWDSLVLSPSMKSELRTQVEGFFASRELYRDLGIPHRRGILLAGPPGNGKTSLLRVIAAQVPQPFLLVSPRQKLDQSDLEYAFNWAAFDAPSILCFEDLDSLFGEEIPMSYFLNRLDGLSSVEGVLVLATTNHPEKLDSALTDRPSRFDRVYVFGNPGPAERKTYLTRRFGDVFDERLVRWTDGLSFAHLKEVWVSACLEAMDKGQARPTLEIAQQAIERVRNHRATVERAFETSRAVGFGRNESEEEV